MARLTNSPLRAHFLWLLAASTVLLGGAEVPAPRPDPSPGLNGDMRRGALDARERGKGGDAKVYKKSMSAGRSALKDGNLVEAEAQFRKAVHEAEGFSPTDKRVVQSLEGWADVLEVQQRFKQLHRVYEDILAFWQRSPGTRDETLLMAWMTVAKTATYAERYDDSEKAWLRAKEFAERLGHPHTLGKIWGGLANAYTYAGKPQPAEEAFHKALEFLGTTRHTVEHTFDEGARRMILKPHYQAIGAVYNDMALFYRNQKRYPEAEAAFQRSLSIAEKETGKKSEGCAVVTYNLGRLYKVQNRLPEAELQLQRSLAIREKSLGQKNLLVAETMDGLAEVHRAQGKIAEATRLDERAKRIRSELAPVATPL